MHMGTSIQAELQKHKLINKLIPLISQLLLSIINLNLITDLIFAENPYNLTECLYHIFLIILTHKSFIL